MTTFITCVQFDEQTRSKQKLQTMSNLDLTRRVLGNGLEGSRLDTQITLSKSLGIKVPIQVILRICSMLN